jgi:type IV pilus assembly protein PilY1
MKIHLLKASITTMLSLLIITIGTAHADDTDVYIRPKVDLPPGSEPMVMFSLDYRSNLGSIVCNQGECQTLFEERYLLKDPSKEKITFFDLLSAALWKVFDPLEGVRVGLMLNHRHLKEIDPLTAHLEPEFQEELPCDGFGRTGCSNGGQIAMGFELFEKDDRNKAKERFLGILESIPTFDEHDGPGHSYQGKELFFEFFRYLTGQEVHNAHNGYLDYGTDNVLNLDAEIPEIAWDTGIETLPADAPRYVSPLETAGACSKVYTVNLMFQVSNQEDDSDDAIEKPVADGGFGSEQKFFENVIQYLNDADLANGAYGTAPSLEDKQNVTSYFIIAEPYDQNQKTGKYARAGGTGVPLKLSENPDDLVGTLQEVFRQILSVSTTFVAASVPVNVFNRAEITDNVYIALFQVDSESRPSWVGNVKKLRLAGANDSTANGVLVDATGTPAIAADGRIRFDALTDWTLPDLLPAANVDAGEVENRDGRVVARGGAGQIIPGFLSGGPQEANGLGGRTIYYDLSPTQLADLDVNPTVAADLVNDFGVEAELEPVLASEELIRFARGLDIDNPDRRLTSQARPWLFGDALHSRPLPLNYGDIGGYSNPDNQAIFIAVATNDGMLRMIRNTTEAGGVESGEEVWAFMPRSAMKAQQILRRNASAVDPRNSHPYTVDGAPVAFFQDINQDGTIDPAEDSVYLYVGMRRGGKAYYAFDVTDPEVPKMLWSIEKGGDFAELGYTFSNPRVGLVDLPDGRRPVVMFAGGYDMNKDEEGVVGSDDSEGNAIYVVDAKTGDLIWKAVRGGGKVTSTVFEHPDLKDSIPSTLATADTDGDGVTDRIVVGDTGGNVWRADVKGSDTLKWKLTQLAALGRHAGGAKGQISEDRRFFHRPDLVLSKDKFGPFDGVVIGSGNRPNPLDYPGGGEITTNYAFMVKDRNTAPGGGMDENIEMTNLGDVTSNCLQSSTPCTVDLSNGWRLKLEEIGEKSLATPITINSKVFFTTYLPKADTGAAACAPSEGAGRLYAVDLQDATAVINYDTSDDDPNMPDQPTTKADRSVELRSLGIPAEVVAVPPNKILRPDLQIDNVDSATRWRTFWYLAEDEDL